MCILYHLQEDYSLPSFLESSFEASDSQVNVFEAKSNTPNDIKNDDESKTEDGNEKINNYREPTSVEEKGFFNTHVNLFSFLFIAQTTNELRKNLNNILTTIHSNLFQLVLQEIFVIFIQIVCCKKY